MNKLKKIFLASVLACVIISQADASVLTAKNISDSVQGDVLNIVSSIIKGRITVQTGNIPVKEVNLPEGIAKIKTKVNMPFFTSTTVVRVELTVNDKVYSSFGVPVKIFVKDRVLVANDGIRISESITSSNVHVEEKDITQNAVNAAREDVLDKNMLSKKVFRTGEIIDSLYLESVPDVIKNAQVNIIFNSDGLNITLTGVALDNGKIGDVIRVRNKDYKKDYIGRVINSNTIQVNI